MEVSCLSGQFCATCKHTCIVISTIKHVHTHQVHVLQYDADQERLACSRSLLHKSEVWDIATSCQQPQVLITVWGQGGSKLLFSLVSYQLRSLHAFPLPFHKATPVSELARYLHVWQSQCDDAYLGMLKWGALLFAMNV